MSGFSVDFVSPVDFEYLAAEICYEGQIICRINCESVELVLDFFSTLREPIVPVSVPLQEFLQLVRQVSSELLEDREMSRKSAD